MINYIKSECYRVLHRKYPYVVTAIFSALTICFSGIMLYMKNHWEEGQTIGAADALNSATAFLVMGCYLVLMFADIVFSDEYKHLTFKNTISFGVPRATIYFGKLITQLITALCSIIIMLLVFFTSVFFMFQGANSEYFEAVGLFLKKALIISPLWVGAMAVANFFGFLIRNNTGFGFAFVGFMLLPQQICDNLRNLFPIAGTIEDHFLLTGPFSILMSGKMFTTNQILECILIGCTYLVVFSILGYIGFRKREIK